MDTNYTKECPLCGNDEVEEAFDSLLPSWANPDDTYFCLFCHSEWQILDDGADYKVTADNTDGVLWETISERCK